jgi:polyisoprenoid-binding protein YceI
MPEEPHEKSEECVARKVPAKVWRSRLAIRKLPLICRDMSTPAFPKRDILVVDDEPLVCEALKMMLEFDGYAVEMANSGQEALAVFGRNKFDLVIIDSVMPGMKGDELAAAIKARDPKQPVMINTFAERVRSSSTGLQGFDDLTRKPFSLENVREAIANATLSLTLANGAAQVADTYNLDPQHSSVGFAVSHMAISTVHGRFNDFTGMVMLQGNQIQGAKGTIQAKSVDSGVAGRDQDLRSANFFDVEKFPTITFTSKRVEQQGGQSVVVGDFTMHGVTKSLSLPVTVKGPIKDAWGNLRIGLRAKTRIDRRDYDLNYNKMLETGGVVVGHEIEIEIDAEATRGAPK